MSNDNKPEKKGRKKGSTDSINVSIETLLKHLKPETVIPVRRLWIQQMETFLNVSISENEKPELEKGEAAEIPSPARERVSMMEEEL